jgi:hypothetical protein
MRNWIKRILFNKFIVIFNYSVIMSIVYLTSVHTPFTSTQAFIGLGLTFLLIFALTYALSKQFDD